MTGVIEFTLNADGTVTVTGRTEDSNGKITYADDESNLVTFMQKKEGTPAEVDVQNEPGVALPSTGGHGTSMFYILGSILTLLGAVLLIARRRTEARESD